MQLFFSNRFLENRKKQKRIAGHRKVLNEILVNTSEEIINVIRIEIN